MDMRHARFGDISALVAFNGAVSKQEWQQILNDPWITVTIAEDDSGWLGWVTYTVDELRQIVVRDDLWGSDLVAELYGEGYRHWRTAAIERARAWVAEDDPLRGFLEAERWRPTGRTRRIPARPHQFMTELMLEPVAKPASSREDDR